MPTTLKDLSALLDVFEIPMFLLRVEQGRTIHLLKTNEAHQRATGFDLSAHKGDTLHDLFPVRMADALLANFRHCIATRASFTYDELLAFGQGEGWWRTVLTPITRHGNIIGIVGFSQNIDAIKATERSLADAALQAGKINADVKALAATMAHDLRGPLRQAKSILSLLKEDFTDLAPGKQELLATSHLVLDKAMAMIDTKLSYMSQSISVGHHTQKVDLGRWCANVLSLLNPLKTLSITHPNALVECEEVLLDVGLRNLIDNAMKYARSKVMVAVQQDGAMLKFSVADDGLGFKATPDALQPAQSVGDNQADNQNEPVTSGYGLETTRQLVEARGGTLWIDESLLGQNSTTISFTIPGKLITANAKIG